MKNFRNYLFLLGLLVFTFTACKKDDEKSKTDYLTSSAWKLKGLTVDPGITFNGVTITDFYAQIPACTKDDTYTFKVGGDALIDEGATRCDPTDPQTTPGTWALSTDEKTLTLDGENWTILTLDGSTFKARYTEVDAGITYNYTITYSH